MAVIDIDDESLLQRMGSFEDAFVERKTIGDRKSDWLKTAVAFANTAPEGFPCVLYIGVTDKGEIEETQVNLDKLQKTFSQVMGVVYPPIPCLPRIVRSNGRQALAIIVWGSAERPHFSGTAYVRDGSQSVAANEKNYEQFIAQRSSLVRALLEYKDKPVRVTNIHDRGPAVSHSEWGGNPMIHDCNQFYLTLKFGDSFRSVPLGRIELSFDHERNTLRLDVHPSGRPILGH